MSRRNPQTTARFERLLCPVDFYPASLRAFEYALKLAANYKAGVHLLHVIPRVMPAGRRAEVRMSPLIMEQKSSAEQLFVTLRKKAESARVPVDTEIRIGDIDLQILRTVKKQKADLLVMGTHGRRKFKRWVMGSVAERMLRHSPIPLFVLGSGDREPRVPPAIRRILLTTDFSPGSRDALRYAFSIAEECKASIVVLHVVNDTALFVSRQEVARLKEDAIKTMASIVPSKSPGGCSVTTRVEVGNPYRVILKTIQSEKPGLVVMNTHGKGMMERVLVGSTAERVVRGASGLCPILLVPLMARRTPYSRGARPRRAMPTR